MEQPQAIKQFPFYDFYAQILCTLKDEEAGRLTKRMCAYMFSFETLTDIEDNKERFYWGNLVDVLEESKDALQNGKAPSGLNRRMKHFAFQENFYDALCLLDERQGGQYVKAICDYMFEDKTPTLKPPVDSFFALAKRKLDLSKIRKRNGQRGGTAKHKRAPEPPLDMDGFLIRQPQVKNDIYRSSMHLTEGVNWSLLNDRLPQSVYRDSTSLYQILIHYRDIVGS
ncbi:MAG: hypothetical protein E7680_00245 [Ruminococcaceae bacterium]|nr:hypothetical protein [Oscillospiraceae bacterium]